MKSSRDFGKSPPATTPVSYRDANTVYRSLSAVPAPLDVPRSASTEKAFVDRLIGPQTKHQGEVVWSETKQQSVASGEAQPCPIPLIVAHTQHNSLFVESNPVGKVVSAVDALFQQHRVDAVFNSIKFKWKCMCYEGEIETRFVSRLFSVPGKANFFVLDFQRRSGDAFHFQSIYKAINFRLLKSGFVVCNDRSEAEAMLEEPVMRTFKPLDLPDDFVADDAVQPNDLEPLCRMCTSQYIDVQREGLSALATQIALNPAARSALAPFASKLMEIISLSRDAQVKRLAASAIAKLSSEKLASQHICEKGGVRVLVNLLLSSAETLETRRHAATALLNVSGGWDSQSIHLVQSAPACGDARLEGMLRQLKSNHLA